MAQQFQRPFLKWAGGKFKLLPHILTALPQGKRLIEPFAGSGVVFLNTHYDHYQLNDTNKDLINLYNTLKAEKETLIKHTAKLFNRKNNTADKFYRLRAKFNQSTDLFERSALFIYLNKHGFNGLCRYNKRGEFNVPFGRHNAPYFAAQEMWLFAEKAQNATFTCADFAIVMQKSASGDVIYCDPPYVPLSQTASFTQYYLNLFSLTDQERLAELAQKLSANNIPVLISNHHTNYTQKLYRKAKIISFDVRRNISCNGDGRGMVKELIAHFASTQ